DAIAKSLQDVGGATLCLIPGDGKTLVALKVFSELGIKTVVVVPSKPLLSQWQEKCAQYVPDAKIGVFYGDKKDYENCDIVISTIQTAIKKEYSYFMRDCGMTIIDEAHRI